MRPSPPVGGGEVADAGFMAGRVLQRVGLQTSLPSGAACPPKPHPRSLSTSWRGRAQRSSLLDSGKPAHPGPPSPLVEKGTGDEASEGRPPQRAKTCGISESYTLPHAHPPAPLPPAPPRLRRREGRRLLLPPARPRGPERGRE